MNSLYVYIYMFVLCSKLRVLNWSKRRSTNFVVCVRVSMCVYVSLSILCEWNAYAVS